MITYHASAVAIGGRAVLIEGPSGSGKSDLAFRLMKQGADLVSDDYVTLNNKKGVLIAAPPPQIAGKIEIRGVGIETFSFVENVPVVLLVSLTEPAKVPRLPEETFKILEGVKIPQALLSGWDASTPDKIRMLAGKF